MKLQQDATAKNLSETKANLIKTLEAPSIRGKEFFFFSVGGSID